MLKHLIYVRLLLLSFLCILFVSIFLMQYEVSADAATEVPADLSPDFSQEETAPEEPVPEDFLPPIQLYSSFVPSTGTFLSFTYYSRGLDGNTSPQSDMQVPFHAAWEYYPQGIYIKDCVVGYKCNATDSEYEYISFKFGFISDEGRKFYQNGNMHVYYVTKSGNIYSNSAYKWTDEYEWVVKYPKEIFEQDGTFYLDGRSKYTCTYTDGYFRDSSIKEVTFVDVFASSFLYTTGTYNGPEVPYDWTQVDASSVTPFPSFPTEGPTETDTPATPAPTSDPALGNINDSINNQMQQDKEQHEETKGLLGTIIDGITSIPGKIIELLTDALKGLFIPSEDFLDTKLKSFQDSLDNMGFLAWPVSASIDIINMLLNSSGSSGAITLPAAQFEMDGKTIVIWEETKFDLADIKKELPDLFDTLNVMFGLMILVLICKRAYFMWAKYFGQKPADVFSAFDIDDVGFNLEADRLDRQGYGL